MTVPAPPVPAEKRPRKSAAGIALRVASALPALLAGLMVIGIIGSMAQGNLGARDAVVDVILLVGLPGALAAGPSRRSPEHRFRGSSPYGSRF